MRGFGAWVCVLVGCVVLWGAPVAFAKEVHISTSVPFGGAGSSSGEFNGPAGIAVNNTTHDVYIVDRGNDRVEEFDSTGSTVLGEFDGSSSPSGSFSEPVGIAVDNSVNPLDPSRGDVYVVDRGHGVIDKFDSSGTYQGQLTGNDTPNGPFEAGETEPRSIMGVAVDLNGVVWVSTYKEPIYSFSNLFANEYRSEVKTAFGGAVEGLGVDSEDNLYFNVGSGFVKINSAGEVLANPFGDDTKAGAVAVDPAGREVYLDNFDTVEAFGLDGDQIESFGSGLLIFSKGLAVDSSNGTVYVNDQSGDDVLVFESITLPTVSVGAVSEQQSRSLTLNGTVSPEGKPVTSCVFEYGTSSAYGQSVPCSPATLGSGVLPVSVSAHLEGLVPETMYHYRLVAENAAQVSSPSPDQEIYTGPLLGGEFVSDVASSSATLRAAIDPNGADTHYYFEYGPTVGYGSFTPVAAPGVDIGSVVGEQSLSVHLQGLNVSAVYHYRFVAVQNDEVFEEPDRSFRTQSVDVSAVLPDGRAWELVSPANKKGALIEPFESGGQVQAANDGSGITYLTEGPHVGSDPHGKTTLAQVMSKRGVGGWESVDLTLPGRLPENGEEALNIGLFQFEYKLFSPDLSLGAVEPQEGGTPPLSPEVTERTLYLREGGNFMALVSATNVPSGTSLDEPSYGGANASEWEMHFLAGTPDLSHVVFSTPLALTSGAIDEEKISENNYVPGRVQWNVYEWSSAGIGLVNILPDGEVAHGRDPVPPVRLAGMTSAGGFGRGGAQRDVSSDGRRVAWTWGEPYLERLKVYRGLYVRDMVEGRTVRVGGVSAAYQTMSSDGSKIFFLENGDLYKFDFDTGIQTDLTGTHGVSEVGGAREAVSDVSEDGSYVYFVATGVLADGGVSGKNNLYAWHDKGGAQTIVYVATLSEEDQPSWYAETFGVPFLARVSSRVSPDGRYLAFMSDRSLTGYDNIDSVSGKPDEEVYLYDAETEGLVCASCDPTGARPVGVFDGSGSELLVDRKGVWTLRESTEQDKHFDHWLAGSVPGWDNLNNNPATYQPRYLSDDGRLFFNSPDGLVAHDTNGLEDVYEFEPVGMGGCAVGGVTFSEGSGGCVNLMSSGTSSSESAFYDASLSGNDVFFATTSRLVDEDFDKGFDVYDAHACTSALPCIVEAVKPPLCSSGDSCKAAPSSQPEIFGFPPSATFSGAGNVIAGSVVKPKSLTRAQKLSRALKACHKKVRKLRSACERRARRKYPVKQTRKAAATQVGRG